MIGYLRGWATERSPLAAAVETLLIGGIAAAVAYAVGALLEGSFV